MKVEVKVTLTPSEKGALKELANVSCGEVPCNHCPISDSESCLKDRARVIWRTLYPFEPYQS